MVYYEQQSFTAQGSGGWKPQIWTSRAGSGDTASWFTADRPFLPCVLRRQKE